jgi:hypothetical protein
MIWQSILRPSVGLMFISMVMGFIRLFAPGFAVQTPSMLQVWNVQSSQISFSAIERSGAKNNVWQKEISEPTFEIQWSPSDLPQPEFFFFYWGKDANGVSDQLVSEMVFSPGKLEPGAYYLRLRTNEDVAGSWQTVFTFLFDNEPPAKITGLSEKSGAKNGVCQSISNQPVFSWKPAADLLSGVDFYEYYFGSDRKSTKRSGFTKETSYSANPVRIGSYFLVIRAKDNAGNYSVWTPYFIFRYDHCFYPATAPGIYWFVGGFVVLLILALLPNIRK